MKNKKLVFIVLAIVFAILLICTCSFTALISYFIYSQSKFDLRNYNVVGNFETQNVNCSSIDQFPDSTNYCVGTIKSENINYNLNEYEKVECSKKFANEITKVSNEIQKKFESSLNQNGECYSITTYSDHSNQTITSNTYIKIISTNQSNQYTFYLIYTKF
jgi:hypothetical protein